MPTLNWIRKDKHKDVHHRFLEHKYRFTSAELGANFKQIYE